MTGVGFCRDDMQHFCTVLLTCAFRFLKVKPQTFMAQSERGVSLFRNLPFFRLGLSLHDSGAWCKTRVWSLGANPAPREQNSFIQTSCILWYKAAFRLVDPKQTFWFGGSVSSWTHLEFSGLW